VTYREGIIKETEFFTTADLAKKLKMNVQVITRKVQAGEIEAYKIGKDWRIPEQSVYNWLEHLSNRAASRPRKKVVMKSPDKSPSDAHPAKRGKRKFLLEYILAQFDPNQTYAEDEVNKIIARYHNDFGAIRDQFVGESMMDAVEGGFRRKAGYQFSA
jgi:excisionase family DNA binding protein